MDSFLHCTHGHQLIIVVDIHHIRIIQTLIVLFSIPITTKKKTKQCFPRKKSIETKRFKRIIEMNKISRLHCIIITINQTFRNFQDFLLEILYEFLEYLYIAPPHKHMDG